jgi:hypothetical protein
MEKIKRRPKAFFSHIDKDVQALKFVQVTGDKVLNPMIEEETQESTTWINHFGAEILIGRYEEDEMVL